MIVCFPSSYPDEILYSRKARYSDHMAYQSARTVPKKFFGSLRITSVEFPGHLNTLANNLPNNNKFVPEKIIEENTLFPLFSPFLTDARKNQIVSSMCSGKNNLAALLLGSVSSTIPMNPFMNFCPSCVVEDRETYGEAYWHRLHQSPGVRVCPKHKTMIKSSEIPNHSQKTIRYKYVSIEQYLETSPLSEPNVINKYFDRYRILAEEINWLLSKTPKNISLEQLRQNYLHILYIQGYATPKNIRNLDTLHRDFIAFYSHDFLKSINCEINETFTETWLHKIFRKDNVGHHPIRHILVANFLGLKIKDIFEYTPPPAFGKSPWPCLNPACKNYYIDVIDEINISYSPYADWRPIGTFICECGFSYTRTGPDQNEGDRYSHYRVLDYGKIWKKSLVEKWGNESLSLREISRQLNVDPTTTKKYALELGLKFPRVYQNRLTKKPQIKEKPVQTSGYPKKDRRKQWLQILSKNPGVPITSLRKKHGKVYSWLYRNDKDWLVTHKPPPRKLHSKGSTRVDWETRDEALAVIIPNCVRNILNNPGKPKQLTFTIIACSTGRKSLIEHSKDKLPKTISTIQQFVETREEFAFRRIEWATQEFIKSSYHPAMWELIRASGTYRIHKESSINKKLNHALNKIQETLET